jgi:hypothetical protein
MRERLASDVPRQPREAASRAGAIARRVHERGTDRLHYGDV